MNKSRRLALALSLAVMSGLTGWGKSAADQRADVVACSAYLSAYSQAVLLGSFSRQGRALAQANEKVERQLGSKYPDLQARLAGIVQGGGQYVAQLDAARGISLQQTAVALAEKHATALDDKAIASHITGCLQTWDKLSKR